MTDPNVPRRLPDIVYRKADPATVANLITLADAVRDAHALYLFRFYGHSPMADVSAAQATLAAAKKALRAAWLLAPESERQDARWGATTHGIRRGDCPHAAVSSREHLEDLLDLPYPTETP